MHQEIQAFLEHLRSRDFARASLRKRRTSLEHFSKRMQERGIRRVQEVTRDMIDSWHRDLSAGDYSPHSIVGYLTSAKLFFAFLEQRGIIFESPAAGLVILKPKPKLGLVLTERQMQALLEQPDPNTAVGLRDRAILELLYGSGGRRTEVALLKLQDLDLDVGTVHLMGKGSKERIVPMGHPAARAVTAYLKDARPQLLSDHTPDDNALWLSVRNGAPLQPSAVRTIVKKYAREAELPPKTDTHTLRRTCATHLLRGGAQPLAVAQQLGHADLGSLAHYLKTTITDLMKTHKKSKPGR